MPWVRARKVRLPVSYRRHHVIPYNDFASKTQLNTGFAKRLCFEHTVQLVDFADSSIADLEKWRPRIRDASLAGSIDRSIVPCWVAVFVLCSQWNPEKTFDMLMQG